jgi:hypothetical protein
MKTLNERRPDVVSLSATQKFVLTQLVAAETPLNAYQAVSQGANVVTARDQLTKAGLMTYQEVPQQLAEITEAGRQNLVQENLIDEMTGELTEEGQIYGYAKTPEEAAEKVKSTTTQPDGVPADSQQQNAMSGNMATDIAQTPDNEVEPPGSGPFESLELIQDIRAHLKEEEFIKKSKS